MIMLAESLGALFELSRDAVIGITDNKICFSNPAAEKLFALHAGDEAAAHFPPELFDVSGGAAASLTVNGRRAEVSIRRSEALWLLCLHPQEEPNDEPGAGLRMARGFSDSLMTLRMALDALLKRCRTVDDARTADYAAILYHEYFRMRRLCSHLSAAENIAQGTLPCSLATIDLEKTISELVDSVSRVAEPLGVDIRLKCESGDYITEADGALLETMLLNFLSNSLQRCDQGGCIRVGLRRSGANALLSVDDNGSGMSSDTLAGALHGQFPFDPSDPHSGAGLGLTLARGIAEKHGGTLLIESSEGHGCRVRVSLPLRKPADTLLHHAAPAYEVKDMNGILTELSVVLPSQIYREKFFD